MFVELQRDWMGQKTGAIIDLAEPDAKLFTDGGVAKAVTHDPLSPLITKAMGSMPDGMQKAVDAAINRALADLLASRAVPEMKMRNLSFPCYIRKWNAGRTPNAFCYYTIIHPAPAQCNEIQSRMMDVIKNRTIALQGVDT